jgi:hypothetical protein
VLLLSLGDPAELIRFRLRRIIETFHLDADSVPRNLLVLDGSEFDTTLAAETGAFGVRDITTTPAFAHVEAAAKTCGLAAFVVFDNASDAFCGDENSRRKFAASCVR